MYDVTYNSRPILRSTEERNDGKVPIESEAVHPSPKLNIELQYFHCCIKYLKLGTDICTPTFTAALFSIAQKWKQPNLR